MKIIMLGSSSVGKTTVLTTSYGFINSKKHTKGLRLKCRDSQTHALLMSSYKRFCRKGEYPESTSRMDTYSFEVSLFRKQGVDLDLVDIRGESIHDYENLTLINEIGQADGVMLLFTGTDILGGADVEETVFDLYSMLNTALTTDDKPKLIMVVITKMELLLPVNDTERKKLEEFFAPLQAMTAKNDRLSFRLLPVACARECVMHLDLLALELLRFGLEQELSVRRENIGCEKEMIAALYGEGFMAALKHVFGMNADRAEAIKREKALKPQIRFCDLILDPAVKTAQNAISCYEMYSPMSVKSGSLYVVVMVFIGIWALLGFIFLVLSNR